MCPSSFQDIADQRGMGGPQSRRRDCDSGTLAVDPVALMDALGHQRVAVLTGTTLVGGLVVVLCAGSAVGVRLGRLTAQRTGQSGVPCSAPCCQAARDVSVTPGRLPLVPLGLAGSKPHGDRPFGLPGPLTT
jgi:hypothetical protein